MNLRLHDSFRKADPLAKRLCLELYSCRACPTAELHSEQDRNNAQEDTEKLCLLLESLAPSERCQFVHELCQKEFPELISPVESLWLERALDAIDSGVGRTNSDLFAFGCYYFSREEGIKEFRVRAVNSFLSDRGRQITSVSAVADQLSKGDQPFLLLSNEKAASEKLFSISPAGLRRIRNTFFRPIDWSQIPI